MNCLRRWPWARGRQGGFALVVTISLMVLLMVVGVGLLSLSAVSLRAGGVASAREEAQANARIALLLALGELQAVAGTDRAITAPASVLDEKFPDGVTGVWKAWTAADREGRGGKDKSESFQRWLVSTPTGAPASKEDQLALAKPGQGGAVPLLAAGTLGQSGAGSDPTRQMIGAVPVPTDNLRANGGLAWVVIDEGVKARADLHEREDFTGPAGLVLRAGAPGTEGITALEGLAALEVGPADSARFASRANLGLAHGVTADAARRYSPDLTVHAASLMTNPVNGGLKHDLSLLASQMTTTQKAERLYGRHGLGAARVPADPAFGLLAGYHELYKKIGVSETGTSRPPADGISARVPARYVANALNPVPPADPLLLPGILRVDLIFSLITRDCHGGRVNNLVQNGRRYMLHMLYLPVVTLHNPYNVPLAFDALRLNFNNVPIAFQFLVDGQPLTTSLVPLNQLYVGSEGDPARSKDFQVTLKKALGSSTSGGLVLQPGQTKLFGTPKVAPTWKWSDESPGVGADGIMLFDWRNDKTANFEMVPKLMTPPTVGNGFDVDWLAPRGLQTEYARQNTSFGEGIVALRGSERIGVNYGPFAPQAGNGAFSVEGTIVLGGREYKTNILSVRYRDQRRLQEVVETGTSPRFPDKRKFPETFPKPGIDPALTVMQYHEANNTPINAYVNPRPFVIFSVGQRTTMESFVPNRTIADSNPVMNLANIDLSPGKDPIGGVPLELVMMPIRNGNAAIEEIRGTEEGFFFGGHGQLRGTPRATLYELPAGPLQSLAQFRHANLAGSGHMPLVTYTVGESRAHPHVGTGTISGTWASTRSAMLDHTWLSNEALWDNYFLSTLADQTGPLFKAKPRALNEVIRGFFLDGARLPNPRFAPVRTGAVPAGMEGDTAWQVAAGEMLLEGGFNVNSTSEAAWVAVLSALREVDIQTAGGVDRGSTGAGSLPRVRAPSEANMDTGAVAGHQRRWQGYRRLTDDQIEALAREIVKEVRRRGPFLSLAEFVNRGVGAASDEANIKGAIQAAIDRAGVNQSAAVEGIVLSADRIAPCAYASPEAALSGGTASNSAEGSPSHLSQGDVLSVIGSRTVPRSDTFRIRAYGEARERNGTRVLAKAWCEAVVQRMPEFVDPALEPSMLPAAGSVAERFGRRFHVVQFRWLAADEV